MKFLYGLGGANVPVIKEYELANASEKISAGAALKCTNTGLVGKNVTGKYIGVAAEDHSGEKELLNTRANGKKIRVDITSGGVYAVPCKKFCALENGTSTTFICEGGYVVGNISCYSVMLVSKGENSTNTDAIGTVRAISGIDTDSSNYTYYIEEGGATCVGDIYAIVPTVGAIASVDYNRTDANFIDELDSSLLVVGVNKDNATVEVKFNNCTLFD